ncbi:adenylyltransferase/cytidyltransferase family protein [Halobiforma nitratireducens]|uniref:FAD synthase n=1 Tax=Halobiforma nitratireducens JCM 10879 TaxID=1227454 RepID=M0M8G0_9EURY|nr:adenylyltransferase/cytidyltransferase family protein [Halobiforma nitratireducens]EMA40899.1 cytidyltransferase-related domain-containing protein [Halobiforma nitratireducens JCM 10879]
MNCDDDAESDTDDGRTEEPTRVVAQGTFDVLHPGHVHYLEQAAAFGDELHVVVANSESVSHKPDPIVSDDQRRDVVAALEMVDHARVGHPSDYSAPVRAIDPDVLVLGYDQHHGDEEVEAMLESWGVDCRVERAEPREPEEEELLSSSVIRERIRERRALEPLQ